MSKNIKCRCGLLISCYKFHLLLTNFIYLLLTIKREFFFWTTWSRSGVHPFQLEWKEIYFRLVGSNKTVWINEIYIKMNNYWLYNFIIKLLFTIKWYIYILNISPCISVGMERNRNLITWDRLTFLGFVCILYTLVDSRWIQRLLQLHPVHAFSQMCRMI